MTNENLRMQMLASIITEGEYKEKLEENKFLNFFKKKEDSTISIFKKERDKLINNVNNDEKLSDEEKSKSIKDIKDAFMAQARQYDMLENKKSLNENFVGIGAINSPFAKREKTGYETAFEHFLGGKYGLKENEESNEEDEDEDTRIDYSMGKTGDNQLPKPPKSINLDINEEDEGKEELVGKIKNLGDYGFTGNDIEFNGLLITCSTQDDDKGTPHYFVYGEDDDSEDGIFQSTNPNEIAEFVLNY